MKNFTRKLTYITFFIVFHTTLQTYAQSTAEYIITFNSVWESTAVDPINGNSTAAIPGNAHWSNLVGTTHNSNYTMVEMGTLASLGIKDVAERGLNNNLLAEINLQISNGNANQWLQESFSPFAAVSSATLNNVIVSSDFPLLSLVSMIAPSPDWMIAINAINLRDGNIWRDEIIIPLFPYDAGTDSGTTYGAADSPTNPAEPIGILINDGQFNANPIGTMSINLNQVLHIDENEIDNVLLHPNPTHGMLQISTSNNNALKKASVFDVLGKQVLQFKVPHQNSVNKLDLTELNKGVYLIKIELENGAIQTKRIVLQ